MVPSLVVIGTPSAPFPVLSLHLFNENGNVSAGGEIHHLSLISALFWDE